jgi:hypothetical protein
LIINQKGPVTYTLNLLPDAKVYLQFHISLLEPADPKTLLQKTFYFKTEEENEFEVKRIVAHQVVNNSQEYLVK